MDEKVLSIYEQENTELAEWFLETYYWSHMKDNSDRQDKAHKLLEIIVSPQCNLGCKYCYIHKNKNTIFNPCLFDEDKTIKNLIALLKWLAKRELTPPLEIFSGELLAQNIGWRVLDTIYEFQKDLPAHLRFPNILIPTNFTFLCDDNLTAKMEDLIEKFKNINIGLSLSASFDGKYMEDNRPFFRQLDIPIEVVRDDAYYDKVFAFIKKHGCGIHPMLYSKGMDKWIQNFDWFQEQMEKHDIEWDAIYLLQVRNPNWTDYDIQHLTKFLRHIYYFAWDKCGHDKSRMKKFLAARRGFNILNQMVGVRNRGMGCAIQRTLHIRLSDFSVVPCHRLGYDDLIIGHFEPDEDDNLRFVNKNIELLLATNGYHHECSATCEHCLVRTLCLGGCIGAQQEENKNMFSNIPSVCKMFHATYVTITKCLVETNCFDIYCENIPNPEAVRDLINLRKVIENNDSEY